MFTATPTTAARKHVVLDSKGVPALDANGMKQYATDDVSEYRFAYSTKEDTVVDSVKVYDIATTATDVKFGAVENGKLVNKGKTKYTEESWNAYIDALGEVVTSINANDPISKTYTATTHLVMAENELEPAEDAEGITVSGTVVWATAINGSAGTYGARGMKFQIKDETGTFVDVVDGEGNVVTTADDVKANYGKFEITVPNGTTEIKILAVEDKVGLPRTVTLDGDADVTDVVIPYIVCDYNASGTMNVTDDGAFNRRFKAKNFYADLNNSDTYNVTDEGAFNRFSSKKISYTELKLDE